MAAQTTYQYVLKMKDKMSGSLKKAGKKGGKAYDRLQRAQSKLNKLNKKFGILAKVSFAAAVGGAVMLSKKLVTSTIKTAEMGDEAAKTGRRLGITAEELQKLRFAADRQGVSASLLDSSFMALQKRVGELRVESGGLYTYLSKKGDTTFMNQIKNAKDTGEAFNMMVARMEQIEDPMDRAAFANAGFSRAGLDMIKMMEAGGEGLENLKQEASDMGAVMSNEAAAKSEKFVDTMTNFKATMKGVKMSIATELMPVIKDIIVKLQGWFKANKEIISQKLSSFFNKVANAAGWIVSNLNTLKTIVGIVIGLLVSLKVATIAVNIAMAANPIGMIIMAIGALITGIILLIKNWDKVKAAMIGAWEVIKSVGKMIKIWMIAPFQILGQVLMDLGRVFLYVFTGKFKKAVQAGKTMVQNVKKGVQDNAQELAKTATGLGEDFQRGYQNGIEQQKEKSGKSSMPTAAEARQSGRIAGIEWRISWIREQKKAGVIGTKMADHQIEMAEKLKTRVARRQQMIRDSGYGDSDASAAPTTYEGTPDAGDEAGTAISAGGSKQTNITISLQNLVNELNISGGDFEETTDNMVTQVREALLRVLNSANQTAIG